MICRIYSVVTVICLTSLLIFSRLSKDEGHSVYLFSVRYQIFENKSSIILDAQLPITSKKGEEILATSERSSSKQTYNISTSSRPEGSRMENNNSHIEAMDKLEIQAKVPNNDAPNEDATDGHFSGQFNIRMLNDHLKKCIRSDNQEVDMDEYIKIFQQLYKFFCMLGTVFGFIGSDVKTKIEILQGYREGENKTHYETVEKMIEFEKSTDYIHSNKESSGSRTFLRLHRSLIFVSKFLNKMDSIEDQDGISRICKEAYAQTLAKFHPWLIQKGAGIAMLGLPTKKDLIAKVCANSHVETEEVAPIMHGVISLTAEIYDQCDKLYTDNDLHGLP